MQTIAIYTPYCRLTYPIGLGNMWVMVRAYNNDNIYRL